MLITNVSGNYFLKQNDTATEIHLAIQEVDGTAVDLSSAARVEVVIGTLLGRMLVKEPTLLSAPGELTFGLDPGDLLPVGDNLVEIHIYQENGEKRVAPSKGHYKLRVQQAIDDLEVVITTYTLDYFLAEVNRITFGLPEAVAEANDLIIRSEQLITGAEIALEQAETARDVAVEAVGVVEPLLNDMREVASDAIEATESAGFAAELANDIADDLLGYNIAISDFSLATTYIKYQPVRANGTLYRAKVETTGNPLPVAPATSNEWFELVAEKGAKGDTGTKGDKGVKGDKGDKGDMGTGLKFLGELETVDQLPTTDNLPGDTYFVGTSIHTWSGVSWKVSEAVKGPKGDPGMNAKTIPLDFVVAADDDAQVDDTLITIAGYTYDEEVDSLQVYRNSRILYPGEDYVMENGSIRVLQPITQRENTTFYIHVRRSIGIVDEDISKSAVIGALGYTPAKEEDLENVATQLTQTITVDKTNFIKKVDDGDLVDTNINSLFVTTGALNPNTGIVSTTATTSLVSEFIDLTDVDFIFRYINDGLSDIANTAHTVAYYDSNKTFISSVANVNSAPNSLHNGKYGYKYTNFPANAKFARINVTKLVFEGSPATKYNFVKVSKTSYNQLENDVNSKSIEEINAQIEGMNQKIYNLQGKKVAVFGDSIMEFGNIPETIAQLSGATVYDCSVGGTRMARHTENTQGNLYNELCMYRLANYINTGNYTGLTQATESLKNNHNDDNTANMNTLKSIDWAQIDIAIIAFGTNDYHGNNNAVEIGTDSDILSDGSTFKGAINYTVDQLLSKYPNLQIIFTTPIYRNRFSSVGDNLNSDIHVNDKGLCLKDYADAIKEVASKNHLPVIDLFSESGINKYTYKNYLSSDELHPSTIGYVTLGQKIAKVL